MEFKVVCISNYGNFIKNNIYSAVIEKSIVETYIYVKHYGGEYPYQYTGFNTQHIYMYNKIFISLTDQRKLKLKKISKNQKIK